MSGPRLLAHGQRLAMCSHALAAEQRIAAGSAAHAEDERDHLLALCATELFHRGESRQMRKVIGAANAAAKRMSVSRSTIAQAIATKITAIGTAIKAVTTNCWSLCMAAGYHRARLNPT